MKAIKRTVAALLATLMLATSTSFTLAAEEYTDAQAVVVAKVNAAGIMTGTDKGFEPSKSLTRAEAAAIIVRMKGISESATKAMAGTTLFIDVPATHWASGYVNQASNLTIVKGVSATEFAPDREVTIAEFVTMAVRALGAGQLVDAEGTWPTNYVNFANENKILNDVTAIYTATATRMNAATIVANTLEAHMWDKTGVKSNGEISWSNTENKTILKDTLNIKEYPAVTVDADVKERTASFATLTNVDVAENVELSTLKSAIKYDVWYNTKSKEVVGIWKSEDEKQNVVSFTEITKAFTGIFYDETPEEEKEGKIKLSVNGADKEYNILPDEDDNATVVYYNGVEVDSDDVDALLIKNENAFGTLVLDGKDIVELYIEEYEYAGLVSEITKTKIKFEDADQHVYATPSPIEYTDEDSIFYVTKDGKEIKVTDIKEDDVVFMYEEGSSDIYHILVSTNKVEGEVTAIGADYIKIDGEKVKFADGLTLPSTGTKVDMYFNEANKAVLWNKVEGTSEFAVISSLEVATGKKELLAEVVLAYADGTLSDKMEIDLDESNIALTAIVKATGDVAKTYNDKIEEQFAGSASEDWAATSILGSVVNYEIKNGKVVLKEFDADTTNVSTVTTGRDDDDNQMVGTASIKVGKTKSYVLVGTEKYYVKSSTDVLVIDSYKKASDAYKLRVNKVDFEDLDEQDTLAMQLIDIDDDKQVSLIVIDERIGNNIKTVNASDDFLTLIGGARIKNDDYNYEYTFADVNGKEYTYYSNETSWFIGETGIVSVNDDELIDIDEDDYDNDNYVDYTNGYYVIEERAGVLYVISTADVDSETGEFDSDDVIELTLSSDVLYIDGTVNAAKDGYTKSKVGSSSKVEFAEEVEDEKADFEDATVIYQFILEEVETGVFEVVGLVY